MSYFLKQTRNKKGTYLQVYESTYDPGRGYGTHRSVRAVGYVHELEQSGIPDPVARLRAAKSTRTDRVTAPLRLRRARGSSGTGASRATGLPLLVISKVSPA